MTITIHDVEQGSPEWYDARLGLLTASEMGKLITPTLKIASNDKERTLLWKLLSERIRGYVEPGFQSYAMIRGHEDEIIARDLYSATYAPVQQCGFMTNDEWDFTLGFSPDGLVGKRGFIEGKSKEPHLQIQHILEHVAKDEIAAEFVMQVQTGFLVSKREWCDHLLFSAGLPMAVVRVFPDRTVMDAILEASDGFHKRMAEHRARYDDLLASDARLIPTERREYSDGDDIVAEVEA